MRIIKQIVQVGGAVLSALWTGGSFWFDIQGVLEWQYSALIGFSVFVVIMAWIVWDKQSQINTMRSGVRLEARMHGIVIPYSKKPLSINEALLVVDEGSGTDLTIDLEIWTNGDIYTDNLILNIVGARISSLLVPKWKIWQLLPRVLSDFPAFRRTVGLRLEKGEYRKYIGGASNQPFKDTVTFKLRGDNIAKAMSWSNLFMMELVLVVGMPNVKYRKSLEWKPLMTESSEPV